MNKNKQDCPLVISEPFNRDDIIRMMAKVKAGPGDKRPSKYEGVVDVFQAFAHLVIEDFLKRTGQNVANAQPDGLSITKLLD